MAIVDKINSRKEVIAEEVKALGIMLEERVKRKNELIQELNKLNNEINELSKSILTANVVVKEFNELVE